MFIFKFKFIWTGKFLTVYASVYAAFADAHACDKLKVAICCRLSKDQRHTRIVN